MSRKLGVTIAYPELYGVVDVRAWRAMSDLELIGEGKRNRDKTWFSTEDYLLYLETIRRVAVENGMYPKEVDKALWRYDDSYSRKNG